jgi:hypothetical protein
LEVHMLNVTSLGLFQNLFEIHLLHQELHGCSVISQSHFIG